MFRAATLACALVACSAAQAQDGMGDQPPLLTRAQTTEGNWSPLVEWMRENVPSEVDEDLSTMIPHYALVWIDRDTVKRSGDLAQAWQHWEFYDADTAQAIGFRSLRLLQRYDCSDRSTIHMEGAFYPGTNLTGTPVTFPDPKTSAPDAANWKALSNLMFEDVSLTVCEDVYFFDEDAPHQ
ncbi:MAG: hypothetical protein K2X07_01255 [Caulobacteraceae bacterium]|nr:hypothetical protein [Caulobacteraceae bacterium]